MVTIHSCCRNGTRWAGYGPNRLFIGQEQEEEGYAVLYPVGLQPHCPTARRAARRTLHL